MLKYIQKTRENLQSEPYGLTFTLFVLAVFSGAIGTKIGLILFPAYSSAAIAAVTEPITTKFLPAYLSLRLATPAVQQQFLNRPILFGAWGGLAFGLAERTMYFVDGATPHFLWTMSLGLHGVFGILAAGALYWRGLEPWGKLDIGMILFGISAAITLHYMWNVVIIYLYLNNPLPDQSPE